MSIGKLILLRHGESEWNAKNLFTGWVDVRLSELGEKEARRGGELLREKNLLPDVLHTSLLRRAIQTAQIALDSCDRHWIPVNRTWRLNERHYGALQGKDKKQTLEAYGEEQFKLWRRSFDVPPPPIDDSDPYSQAHDPRYADLGASMPKTECLKDVVERLLPYLNGEIAQDLQLVRRCLSQPMETRFAQSSNTSPVSLMKRSLKLISQPEFHCSLPLIRISNPS